jgi:glycosyltransferase involved in cell wall biosynthesis
MRLLYITAEVPYPLTSGYLRHFHVLKGLSRQHDVTLLSLSRRGELAPDAAEALGAFVSDVEVVPRGGGDSRPRLGRARRLVRRRRAGRRLEQRVRARLDAESYDAVLLSGKDTFPALRAAGGTPVVVDVCDATSTRLRGQLGVAPLRRRPGLAVQLAQVRRIERALTRATPHLLFASKRDRAAVLGPRTGGQVVPNAVDLDYWQRDPASATGSRVVLTGVMNYAPNHDAAMRLAERILPRVREEVPDAELVIGGRDPGAALRAAADERPWMTVTGEVPDLRPEIEAAAVYCAPLRFASGIQNKVLEALAMEVPVVTTPVVADGVRAGHADPPLVVAEDDDALAAAVTRLLQTPEDYGRLAADGRRYVQEAFSWSRSVRLVERELERAAAARPALAPPHRPLQGVAL